MLFKEAQKELRSCRYAVEKMVDNPNVTRQEVMRAVFEWVDKLDQSMVATIHHLETLTMEVEELQKR